MNDGEPEIAYVDADGSAPDSDGFEDFEPVGDVSELDGDSYDCVVCDVSSHTEPVETVERLSAEFEGSVLVRCDEEMSDEEVERLLSEGATEYVREDEPACDALLVERARRLAESHEFESSRLDGILRDETLVELIDEGFYILDDEGRFSYVNTAMEELTGYDESELLGEHVGIIKTDENVEKAERCLAELLSDSSDRTEAKIEVEIQRKNGTSVTCEDLMTPFFEDGDFVGTVGTLRDITERKEREEKLEVRTRAMEKTSIALTLSDPSKPDNPLSYVNKGFEDVTGYSEDEVVGRNCRFLQGEATSSEKTAEVREAVDKEEPVTVDLRNYRKDGTEFWNRLHIEPIYNSDGELVNYLGSQRDVTEEKERKRELEVRTEFLAALTSSAEKFLQADSEEEVFRNIVETLTTGFGFETASVYGWEPEEAELVRRASEGSELPQGVEAGDDSPIWDAFASGETVQRRRGDGHPLRCVPAGENWVIVTEPPAVGTPRSEEICQSYVEVLAAYSEATLSNLRKEDEIISYVDRIEEQKASLERLEKLNSAIRKVISAVLVSESKERMLDEVCEILRREVEVDLVHFSVPETNDDEVDVDVRYYSGDDTVVDRLVTESDAEGAPVLEAWKKRETVAWDIAPKEGTDWRRVLVEKGLVSCVSIPLARGARKYGVLEICSGDRTVLDPDYVDVLSQLGEMLSYALDSYSRKKADEATVADVVIDGDACVMNRLATATPTETTLEIDGVVPRQEENYTVSFTVPNTNTSHVEDAMESLPSVEDFSLVTESDSSAQYTLTTESLGPLRNFFRDTSGRVVSGTSDGENTEVTVEVVERESLKMIEGIDRQRSDVEIITVESRRPGASRHDGEPLSSLTEREREVLLSAYHNGYFNWPRDVNGEELAEEMGISKTTLYEHLRSAEKKVLKSICGTDEPT